VLEASRGYLVSWALSVVVEGALGVLMIGLFAVRVVFAGALSA
jgi:hypothetical protein